MSRKRRSSEVRPAPPVASPSRGGGPRKPGWLARQSRPVRVGLAAGLAAVGLVGAYLGWIAVRAENRFQAALEAERRGDFPTARDLLGRCLTDEPASDRFLFHAARAARRDGDFAPARKLLALARERGWPGEAIDWELTLLRAQSGDFEAALPKLRVAVEAAPDHPDADLIREVLVPEYMARFRMSEAYHLLIPWVERRPGDVRLRLWTFEVARRMLLPQLAIDSARAAVAVAPDSVDARAKCGEILIENHQPVEAREHFEWLLARRPYDSAARFGLAKCLRELGDDPGAVRELTVLLRDHPDRPAYLAERGYVDLHAGQPAAARDWLRRAVEADPSNTDLLYNYALCLERCGQPDEAKRWRERHARAEADLLELKEVTKRVAGEPGNPDLRHRAGELMLRNGHDWEGVRWVRSALAVDPNHVPSRKTLDEYYARVRGANAR
jgi:tetratricopeptide (TPR) repeat protein